MQLGDRDELHSPHEFSRVTCVHGTGGTSVGVGSGLAPVWMFGVSIVSP